MAVYFNPPPNWPAPPKGWVPADDWVPDRSLPIPPDGWPLFAPLPWMNSLMRRGIKWAVVGLLEALVTAIAGTVTGNAQITGWGTLGGVLVWVGVVMAALGVVARIKSVREAVQKDRAARARQG